MVVYKRKKNTRQRGSHTHGWGSKKKHRGAGHRGGRGMAGSGKRADQIKPSLWKERYFGKFGFKKKGVKEDIKSINICVIDEKIGDYISKKLIVKEDDFYVVDLEKLGYNKLLGNGRIKKKFKITTPYASKKVIERIKNANGIVVLTKPHKSEVSQPKEKAEVR